MPLPQRLAWALLVVVIAGLSGVAIYQKAAARSPSDSGEGTIIRLDEQRPVSVPLNGPDMTRAENLPILKTIKPFTFTNQHGSKMTEKDFKDQVWVAAFVFTRCSVSCPMITSVMAALNKELADTPEVKLVSFSMDPEFDTPEVLTKYAEAQSAVSARWYFLTGNKEDLLRMTHEDFMLAATEKNAPNEQIIHSNKIALVDREGRVRGYFAGSDVTRVKEMAATIRKLLKQ